MNDIITILAPVAAIIGAAISTELIEARLANKTQQREERKAKRRSESRRVERIIRENECAEMFQELTV